MSGSYARVTARSQGRAPIEKTSLGARHVSCNEHGPMPFVRLARALPVTWLASLLLVLPLTGCTRHGANGLLFAIRVVELAAVVAASTAEPPPPQEIVVRHEIVVRNEPPPAPSTPSTATRVPVAAAPMVDAFDADRRAFDAMGARTMLHSIDVSACRARELPRGHGHAIVTFAPSGAVTEILIDEPAGLSPRAVACLAESYRTANVRAFSGAASVEVGTTWFAP